MNVYFIDPQYVKPECWLPLLSYLKVKSAYSFIPTNELNPELLNNIKPYLKASYYNQNYKQFCDNCAYWLKSHFEENIKLITEDYQDVNNIPIEEKIKYGINDAYSNILNLNEKNCLVLLRLTSSYSSDGKISSPQCLTDVLQERNLPTHIAKYCLNILKKKYGHNQYYYQSAFICFEKYFRRSYAYIHRRNEEWDVFCLQCTDKSYKDFTYAVKKGITKIAPNLLTQKEIRGENTVIQIITEEGEKEYKQFIQGITRDNSYDEDYGGDSWDDVAKEWNNDFWNEMGESWTNLD